MIGYIVDNVHDLLKDTSDLLLLPIDKRLSTLALAYGTKWTGEMISNILKFVKPNNIESTAARYYWLVYPRAKRLMDFGIQTSWTKYLPKAFSIAIDSEKNHLNSLNQLAIVPKLHPVKSDNAYGDALKKYARLGSYDMPDLEARKTEFILNTWKKDVYGKLSFTGKWWLLYHHLRKFETIPAWQHLYHGDLESEVFIHANHEMDGRKSRSSEI
jgi:hypothetical protein